jgi:hypothetical protein
MTSSQTPKVDRIIVFVHWGNKTYDGLSVKHTDEPMSRISERVVLERWNLAHETYSTLVGEGATGRMGPVIDLTWVLGVQEFSKSYTTTFLLVPDDIMKSDAEFGLNKFDPPCSSRQKKGHSVTSIKDSHLFQSFLSNSSPRIPVGS